jgi:DNA-binding PadR family transcriptional regulator
MASSVDRSGRRSRKGAPELTVVDSGVGNGGRVDGGRHRGRRRGRRPRRTSNCRWAVLVLLMERIAEPTNRYGIAKALRGREGAPGFTESSVYREIDRVVKSGEVDEEEMVTSRGRLRGYVLSMKGREAVLDWVRTPAGIPIEVCPEAWLRVAAIGFSPAKDVRRGLSGLAAELDDREDELERKARIARRKGPWSIAVQLDLGLERAALDASRRWVGEAMALLESSEGTMAS